MTVFDETDWRLSLRVNSASHGAVMSERSHRQRSVPMTLGCHASSAVAPMSRAAAPFHIITVIYS